MKVMSSHKNKFLLLFGLIIGLSGGLLLRSYRSLEIYDKCSTKPNIQNRSPLEIINLNPDDNVSNSQNNLLFVGVMTAKSFLKGRAKAVYDTWGKEIPGKIAFFSSERSYSDELPLIALPGVDDRYPPQKKSFMMLYYMYEHFIDKFEWFARTDDDVYINSRKLERFLRSIDSSKPKFIGQAGKGNSEEFGLLSLEYDENFCMGGPGVILSRETLRRVAPHIPTCLKNLYSTHEDVEVGRCVQKYAGIPCTWNYEMQSILHHNSSGKYAFTGNLKSKEIHSAITLHPIKKAPLMYRLHAYMQGLYAQELRQEAMYIHRDIAQMRHLLRSDVQSNEEQYAEVNLIAGEPIFPHGIESDHYLGDHDILGLSPDLKKHTPIDASGIQHWDFIARSFYSIEQANPKKKFDSSFREGLEDVITEVMENINNYSRQRGRVIEFRELLYGYSRVNTVYGHDLILDLLLIYKKYRGKKMTVPVRRHLYVQRAFTDIFIREITNNEHSTDKSTEYDYDDNKLSMFSLKVKDFWNTGLEKLSNTIIGATFASSNKNDAKIVFTLSLAGRFSTFLRFLRNYEEICLEGALNTELLIVFFSENESDLRQFFIEIDMIRAKHKTAIINLITLSGNFSRGKALDTAARSNYVQMNDIIFFIDVDITFTRESIDRIRMNTQKRKQVYLPIVFSEYDPIKIKKVRLKANEPLSDDYGYFRQFGYGICAIYKSDIMDPGIDGFNTDITGWGLEDVRFLEQIIKLNQKHTPVLLNTATIDAENAESIDEQQQQQQFSKTKTKKQLKLAIFRAPDPSLIHVFHEIHCDKNLEESQYLMCLGTKGNTLGSYKLIESVLFSNKTIVDYIRNLKNDGK